MKTLNLMAVYFNYETIGEQLVGLAPVGKETELQAMLWAEKKWVFNPADMFDEVEALGGSARLVTLTAGDAFQMPDELWACDIDVLQATLDAAGEWVINEGEEEAYLAAECEPEPVGEEVVIVEESMHQSHAEGISDELMNRLIQGIGVMPVLGEMEEDTAQDEWEESYESGGTLEKFLPRVTRSIYKAKGQLKGHSLPGSPYQLMTEFFEHIADNEVNAPINERKEGLYKEAMQLIYFGREQGVSYDLPSFYEAKKALDNDQFNPDCPVHILVKYRRDIYAASQEVTKYRETVLFPRYESRGGTPLLDRNKVSTDWLLRACSATDKMVHHASKLEAQKDVLTSYFQMLADRAAVGESDISLAVLVTNLYVMNIQEQVRRRKDLRQKIYDQYLSNYYDQRGNTPTDHDAQVMMDRATEEAEAYSDKGFSSIQNLFPLGSVQFLEWIGSGAIQTTRTEDAIVSVFLRNDTEFTPEQVKALENMEGRDITFENGKWLGMDVSEEDLYRQKDKLVSPEEKDLADKSPEMRDYLMNARIKRGAKLWVGGSQSGRVVHVKVYHRWVMLYLDEFRQL